VFGKVIDGMDVVDKIKTVPDRHQGPAPERAGGRRRHPQSHPGELK
jgi:cyclophilin family peptidyl-prolyl cis-trans isomerase